MLTPIFSSLVAVIFFERYADMYNKNGRIGIYTRQEREAIITRFKRKRGRRVWKKKIRCVGAGFERTAASSGLAAAKQPGAPGVLLFCLASSHLTIGHSHPNLTTTHHTWRSLDHAWSSCRDGATKSCLYSSRVLGFLSVLHLVRRRHSIQSRV